LVRKESIMPKPKLLPLSKVKRVLDGVTDEMVVQYEGAVVSQVLEGGQCVSVVELKVVFEDDDDTGTAESSPD
jgi:hypothetical protein